MSARGGYHWLLMFTWFSVICFVCSLRSWLLRLHSRCCLTACCRPGQPHLHKDTNSRATTPCTVNTSSRIHPMTRKHVLTHSSHVVPYHIPYMTCVHIINSHKSNINVPLYWCLDNWDVVVLVVSNCPKSSSPALSTWTDNTWIYYTTFIYHHKWKTIRAEQYFLYYCFIIHITMYAFRHLHFLIEYQWFSCSFVIIIFIFIIFYEQFNLTDINIISFSLI